jgi:hypothetical protein
MTQVYEIPTTATPQKMSITLSGVLYQLLLKWNGVSQCWILDISDDNGTPILCGIAVITGVDLLEPYSYLGFGGQLFALTDNNPDLPPNFTNLGTTGHLYWVTV